MSSWWERGGRDCCWKKGHVLLGQACYYADFFSLSGKPEEMYDLLWGACGRAALRAIKGGAYRGCWRRR